VTHCNFTVILEVLPNRELEKVTSCRC